MLKYECNDCGNQFAADEIRVKQDREYVDGRLMNINYIESCPYCGSEDFDLCIEEEECNDEEECGFDYSN